MALSARRNVAVQGNESIIDGRVDDLKKHQGCAQTLTPDRIAS